MFNESQSKWNYQLIDKKFQKQLEQFGIEASRVEEVSPALHHKYEFSENSKNIVRALMDTVGGRQWVYSKLAFCGVFATPYVPEHPLDTAFQCGMQEIGHHLQREIEMYASEQYYTMVTEAATRAKNTGNG